MGGFLAKVCLILKNKGDQSLSRSELVEAVQAGNLMAGQVVQRYGCDFPKLEVLNRIIHQN